MRSLRVKAWFKATPQTVHIDKIRAANLGNKNLTKLVSVSRKHKTNIMITSQTPRMFMNAFAMRKFDTAEHKSLMEMFKF